jgi:hypothetical protein
MLKLQLHRNANSLLANVEKGLDRVEGINGISKEEVEQTETK